MVFFSRIPSVQRNQLLVDRQWALFKKQSRVMVPGLCAQVGRTGTTSPVGHGPILLDWERMQREGALSLTAAT